MLSHISCNIFGCSEVNALGRSKPLSDSQHALAKRAMLPAWTRCTPPSKSLPLTAIRRRVLLPSLPHDEFEADQLASPHFDGPHHRAIVGTAALRGVRRSSSLGQALASRRRTGQAVGAQRVIIRHPRIVGTAPNSETLLSKRLAPLSNRGAYPVHTFPSSTGDRKGIGHARGPDPFGMVRHSPSVFSGLLKAHAPSASTAKGVLLLLDPSSD